MRKFSVDPTTVPDDPPAGPGKACPLCGGTDVRVKFANHPSPITYCVDCMAGTSPAAAAVDMHVFESCLIQSERKRGRIVDNTENP